MLIAHAYCRQQSHAHRCDSPEWETRRASPGASLAGDHRGAGVGWSWRCVPADASRWGARAQGPELVLKAAARRLSYAAAVSGLVDKPGTADISQSELGDVQS